MGAEKDSEHETYELSCLNSHGEYASPYAQRDDNVYTTTYATWCEEGFEIKNNESLFIIGIWTQDSRVHYLKTLLSRNMKINTMNMGAIMLNIKNILIVD